MVETSNDIIAGNGSSTLMKVLVFIGAKSMQNTSVYEEPRSSGKRLYEYSARTFIFPRINICPSFQTKKKKTVEKHLRNGLDIEGNLMRFNTYTKSSTKSNIP